MTLIKHYVSNITEAPNDVIIVIFKEMVPNDTLVRYVEQAKEDWKEQQMPGELPRNIVDFLRQQRFKNQFEMNFPKHTWKQNELRIGDAVNIDMPLTLSDVKRIEEPVDV